MILARLFRALTVPLRGKKAYAASAVMGTLGAMAVGGEPTFADPSFGVGADSLLGLSAATATLRAAISKMQQMMQGELASLRTEVSMLQRSVEAMGQAK